MSTDLIPSPETPSDVDEVEEESAPAVWHDSDDERIAVSLASQARLRKLRVTESEDVISGKEYIRRLRRQFQRLHPTPDWANPELAAKRRKTDSDDSDAGSGEELDSDAEDEQLSMQPLAKLLQNATDLTRVEDNARSGGKRKLRQEVLDIQRLKDVGKAQPVGYTTSLAKAIKWKISKANDILNVLVFCRFSHVPSSLPAPAILWSFINSLLAPHLPLSTSSQPSAHILAHPSYAHPHICFRSAYRQ